MDRKDHIQTLENDNSLLHLYVAAITYDGSFLVHTNYDEDEKVGIYTLPTIAATTACKGVQHTQKLNNGSILFIFNKKLL